MTTIMTAAITADHSPAFAALAAKLLAPLPDGEERVASPRFLKRLENDRRIPWEAGLQALHEAEAAHTLAVARDRREKTTFLARYSLDSYKALVSARDAQCCIPAPSARETRWKARQQVEKMSPAAREQYSRDCARHGVKPGELVAPRKVKA